MCLHKSVKGIGLKLGMLNTIDTDVLCDVIDLLSKKNTVDGVPFTVNNGGIIRGEWAIHSNVK